MNNYIYFFKRKLDGELVPVEERSARAMLYNPNQSSNFEFIGRTDQKEFADAIRALKQEYQEKATELASEKDINDETAYDAFVYKQIRFLAKKDRTKILSLITELAEKAGEDKVMPKKLDVMTLDGTRQTNQLILGAVKGL